MQSDPLNGGEKYGRLVIIREADPVFRSRTGGGCRAVRRVICRCVCGNEVTVFLSNLRRGQTKSCGCLRREITSSNRMTHGETIGKMSSEYATWKSMRARCQNPNDNDFQYYGGRGINVCRRWQKFENFLADMGRRPSPELSIDRINNDGDYEPGNCRWATPTEQSRNRRSYRNSHSAERQQ